MNNTVEILLATYNGERYLKPLLTSIQKQTYTNWRLLIRDDGSTDNTIDIIKNFKENIEHSLNEKQLNNIKPKILLITDDAGNLGPVQNFAKLLHEAKAEYFMFCDQDDLWKPTKIKNTLAAMKKIENQNPKHPVLVHTDLTVIDEQNTILAESFWGMQKLNPRVSLHLPQLLLHNVITGCTVMINQPAKHAILPIPPTALMHDYWMGIMVAKTGIIGYIPTATVMYRQHSQNQVGAKAVTLPYIMSKLHSFITEFQKYLKMLQYLPFSPPLGKAMAWKIALSFQRFLLPTAIFQKLYS